MRLPFLLSVPHAGLAIPEELADINLLTAAEIAHDGDEEAAEIYNLRAHVVAWHSTDIARAFVDQNRAEDDIRKDGVVKTHTCWDVPIYETPLDAALTRALLDRYHRPYHRRLTELSKVGVQLGLDCHTMAETAPPVGPDPGQLRPDVCLSNADGTCPPETFERIVNAFRKAFGDDVREGVSADVRANDPFRGGHIIRAHQSELPWVQVELRRGGRRSPANKQALFLQAISTL